MKQERKEADELFEKEFPILRHLFKNNQAGYEIGDFREYSGGRMLLLYTSRYHCKAVDQYLGDERNLQGWKVSHVIASAYSQQRLWLEIFLVKEDEE